jgi:hypothetical protein
MRDPHVRFCERHGGAIPRAYSTRREAMLTAASTAQCLIKFGSLPSCCLRMILLLVESRSID